LKLYLLEAFNSELKFEKDSSVIALTPLVCYQLDKAGVKYSIIEDFYNEIELAATEDEYYQKQLQWIRGLDAFLRETVEEIKKTGLNLATIYYYYLKTAVLDPVFLHSYAISKLLASVKPASVTYIYCPSQEISWDFSLFYNGCSHWYMVTEAFRQQNNIPLESVVLDRARNEHIFAVSRKASVQIRLKRIIVKSGLIKRAHSLLSGLPHYCKRIQACLFAGKASEKQLNILLLKISHIGENFIVKALRKGHRIFLLSHDFIFRFSCFGVSRTYNLMPEKTSPTTPPENAWVKAAGIMENHILLENINKLCKLDVSKIILPQLKYFISRICPELYSYYRGFSEFYNQARIDIVMTPHEVSPVEFAAIAASNKGHQTRSVCVQHGDSVFDVNFWKITELLSHRIYISSNQEMMDYLKSQCRSNNMLTEFYLSPHRFQNIIKIRQKKVINQESIKRNRIIYLPTVFIGNRRRFDGQMYPDTWYYKFQKALVEYFASRKEHNFVWKGLSASEVVYNPIPDFIKDGNFTNIEIATDPFIRHLPSADRVICDYPSTGFYESIVAGIPTISLYPRALKVRKSAIEYFGKLLAPFSDFPEAIVHVDEFLKSDPEQYRVTLDMEGEDILDILEKVGRDKS